MTNNRCVFYIADQPRYVEEARNSAKSLKDTTPDTDAILFFGGIRANEFQGIAPFDKVIKAHYDIESEFFYLKHTEWMVSALQELRELNYEFAIFADTDTYFCSDISEAFRMLSRFDMLGAHAPGRKTTETTNGVISNSIFPEINIGFLPMILNERVIMMWAEVLARYKEYSWIYKNNDQGPLRDVLIEWIVDENIVFHTLPPEWNCRFNFPCMVAGEVKVLHGRHKDLAYMANKINKEKGMRSWRSGKIGS